MGLKPGRLMAIQILAPAPDNKEYDDENDDYRYANPGNHCRFSSFDFQFTDTLVDSMHPNNVVVNMCMEGK